MRIKRYLAPDMRQALRMVREEQGPDAVVISSRRTEAGTELLVALEYDEQLVAAMGAAAPAASSPAERKEPTPESSAGAPSERASHSPGEASRPSSANDEALGAMGGELRKLRAALEQQLRWLGGQGGDPSLAALRERIEALGLNPALAEELLTEVSAAGLPPERHWLGLQAALRRRIRTIDDDPVNHGGVFALIGPTGVGKTTTVAKLAARFALRYGRRHVALITTDTYRIGAREELLTFGEILGIPIDSASSRSELAQLLEQHASKRLVLIDNAGLSQRDLRLAAQLSTLERIPLIKSFLVVSGVTHPAGLDEIFRAFGRARLQGCVVTKLDEAVTLGPVIGTLMRHQVPLVYACDGQRVPEDLHAAASVDLVERAQALAKTLEDSAPEQEQRVAKYRTANGLV